MRAIYRSMFTAARTAAVNMLFVPPGLAINPPHPSPSSFSPQLVHTGSGPTATR